MRKIHDLYNSDPLFVPPVTERAIYIVNHVNIWHSKGGWGIGCEIERSYYSFVSEMKNLK